MVRVIDRLRAQADYVIFDTPPVLAVTDAIVLAARTDGTILVTEAGRTRTGAVKECVRLLSQANARIAGVVLNRLRSGRHGYYYYRHDESQAMEVEAEPAAASIAPQPPSEVPDVPLSTSDVAVNPPQPTSPPPPAPEKPAGYIAPRLNGKANGHSNGTVHTNGNGHGHMAAHEATAKGNGHARPLGDEGLELAGVTQPLSSAVSELLSHLDDTVGLIRSLKPGADREEPRGL
jgi:hypothetical protein